MSFARARLKVLFLVITTQGIYRKSRNLFDSNATYLICLKYWLSNQLVLR